MSIKSDKECAKAVATLIEWQNGNMAELARVAGVSRVGCFKWARNGYVSEPAAALLSRLNGCPLTFTQIRPDLSEEVNASYETKEMKGFVKSQNEYLKNKARVAKAKSSGDGAPTREAKRVKRGSTTNELVIVEPAK